MGNSKREKSAKYRGVYWRNVESPDGQRVERMYYIRYRRGGRGSKEVEEPIGTSGSGMTEAKANMIRGERINGKDLSNTEKREKTAKDKLTGGELTFARLWELYRQANAEKASMKGDIIRYGKHLEKKLANKPIPEIQTADIEAIRKATERKGLSPQTVKHVLGQIRRVIKYGVKLGICSMPDKLYFDMPKVDNIKTETMTTEQLAAYIKAIDEEADQDAAAFLRLALLTGMRKGALMALRWNDIDFELGFITLRGEAAKNGKTARIPLIAATREILQCINRSDSEYVFPGKDGGQRADYKRIAQRVRNKAGLPADFRPLHGLRHVYGSTLATSGADIYRLKDLMTHSSLSMTMRYIKLADEELKKTADMANILAGKK